MNLEELVGNQTEVSTGLATHLLLSKKYVNSNVVFSPASIHAVLSLMAAGSSGPTLDQLLAFLKAKNIDELNSLSSHLVSVIFAPGNSNGGPCLSYANGVWVDKTLPLEPSFKQVAENVYKATCQQVDFQNKATEVVDKVNLWAEKQTNGLIKDVVPVNVVNEFTRLIFANAVYFNGAWRQEFDGELTDEYYFHLLNGNKVIVPFMSHNQDQFISEYDGFKVARLPYLQSRDRRHFSMYFFLPDAKDGLQSLVEKITSTAGFFDRHIPHQEVEIELFMIPRFNFSFEFEASSIFKELGLILPFEIGDGLAEFVDSSAGQQLLYASSIYHKSLVKVNEKGTEAAAATMDSLCGCALGEVKKRICFVANHPFLFAIREDVSGVILFIGHVSDPSIN